MRDNLARGILIGTIAVIGVGWIWLSNAAWVGCDTGCSDARSYARWAAVVGTLAFIGAGLAGLNNEPRTAKWLALGGLLAGCVWFALLAA